MSWYLQFVSESVLFVNELVLQFVSKSVLSVSKSVLSVNGLVTIWICLKIREGNR